MKTRAIQVVLVAIATGSLLAATGCASSYKKITPEQQAAIHRVSVAQSVPVPETPMVFGPAINAGGFFVSPLAALGADSKDNPDSQALLKHFADHQIDLGAIVRQEFVAGLVQIRAFPAIDVAPADAVFEVTVETYGLGPAGFTPMSPINHPLNPNLRLAAKLTSTSGEVLWQSTAFMSSMSDRIEAHMLDEILANPERTREAFRKAAEIVCGDLLKDFGAHPAAVR